MMKKMRKLNIAIVCSLMVLLTACSKENMKVALPNGSVSFVLAAGKDTLEVPVSILKDTTLVLNIKAALSGAPSSGEHWVTFSVDTTKIIDYRAKYGDAMLLPTGSYLFHKPTTRIASGTSISEGAELNIGAQTKLDEYSTYVLPVVIKAVDGKEEGTATSQVLYYVIKTGKPLFVNKKGWTIEAFSSQNSAANGPDKLLDNNKTTTYWITSISQPMPQWVTINFNREVNFTSLVYYIPTLLSYPTNGGYPTSIQIEISIDGKNWVNKGVFTGKIVNNMQTLDVGLTTARYLRFTCLASVKYVSTYELIFLSDISLVP